MTWLWVTIIAYAILGFVSVVNRYLLAGPLPDPRVYAFYVGLLPMLIFLLTPIFGLTILPSLEMALSFLSGFLFLAGLFFLYAGLHRFEASRLIPAIGGLTPIFTLLGGLVLFSGGGIGGIDWLAFVFLIAGSVFITVERGRTITLPSFRFAVAAAVFLSLSFVLAKYVYLTELFWSPFVWMRVGGFIFAAGIFFVSPELRRTIFKRSPSAARRGVKTAAIFIGNQVLGAAGNVLQNFAFFLVPAAYVAFINALEGIIYVFVLIFSALASIFLPHLIRETFTGKTALQKIIATTLIVVGIIILTL